MTIKPDKTISTRFFGLMSAILFATLLTACAGKQLVPYSTSYEPLDLAPGNSEELSDGRSRFREIFCAINQDHGKELPDYMPCDEALTNVGKEAEPSQRPVNLDSSRRDDLVLLVPGLGYQCIKNWLDHDNSAPNHVARYGYEVEFLEVSGLSGSPHNARMIRDYVLDLPPQQAGRPLILVGYSKGAPDILEALVSYPELAEKVTAVISFAGAIGGSLLADDATLSQVNLLTKVPRSDCDKGDGKSLESLSPEVRKAFLADNRLPGHIRYYSVIAFPSPERISFGLKSSYRKLARIADARNDSQLVFSDQLIPGSTVLAFVNADHWAMAVPVARQHKFAASTFVSQNNYPREVILEALLRYLEEDLSNQP
jgi:hypothetical protein